VKGISVRIEAFLRESPVFQVARIARRMDATLNRLLEDEEITLFEGMILAAVFFEKRGETKPSALAEAFQTTRGNVSHCISSLEAKGLLQRKIDPEDARAVQLMLRPQGKKKAVRVVGILDRMQRHFEEGIGSVKLQAMLAQLKAVEEICIDARRVK
jgi:DNA-binding MarR family transcriptional regulator